jgi:hypothetical protein
MGLWERWKWRVQKALTKFKRVKSIVFKKIVVRTFYRDEDC